MCFNCGCGIPHDDMGHADNITNHTFEHLAQKLNTSPQSAKQKVLQMLEGKIAEPDEIKSMFTKAANAWGQSEDEARSETLKMLKKELNSD